MIAALQGMTGSLKDHPFPASAARSKIRLLRAQKEITF
jgi:hypothetical protein